MERKEVIGIVLCVIFLLLFFSHCLFAPHQKKKKLYEDIESQNFRAEVVLNKPTAPSPGPNAPVPYPIPKGSNGPAGPIRV